jgi:hypothetical protein
MSEQQEQLYGREGIEASQGFTPMPLADAPPQEDLALDASVENFVATRDDPAPIVEREFRDVQSGQPRPSSETLSAEDAARNVANVRDAERRAAEEQQNRDLQEALDQLRAPEQQPVAVDEQVTGRTEAQPDYTPQPDYPEAVQMDPQIDPEIAAAFQNPKIRAVLEQASQGVEQTKAQFQQATAELATQAQGVLTALFPELSNLSGPQLQGALQYMQQSQPERFQQFQQLAGRAQQLVGVYRAQQAQAAQQQQELAAAQFRQFATWHDGHSLVNETPESIKQIQTTAIEEARRAGITERELVEAWNTTPALRHSFVQNLMADGVKFRISQRALSQRRANPVPHLQRPGISEPARIDDGAVSAALARLNAPGGSEGRIGLKNAAALVAARRGNRR